MMWIQVLVILVVAWLLWFVARQPPSTISALKKVGVLAFMLVMIISVLVPQVTTGIANAMGIGRGADLLLYGLAVAFVVYALTQYTRAKANRRVMYQLGRNLALLDATERYRQRLGAHASDSIPASEGSAAIGNATPPGPAREREDDPQ